MKEIFNKSTRNFSTVEKTFSDWDQIRDLVNDQLPKGVKKVEKVRGSETDKSYKVRAIYQSGKSKEIEVPITGKDALGNYNRATRSKVENTTRHEVSEENKEKYRKIIKYGSIPTDSESVYKCSDPDKLRSAWKHCDDLRMNEFLRNNNTPSDVIEDISRGYLKYLEKGTDKNRYSGDAPTVANWILSHPDLTEDTIVNTIKVMKRLPPERDAYDAKRNRECMEKLCTHPSLSPGTIDLVIDAGFGKRNLLLKRDDLSQDNFKKICSRLGPTSNRINELIDHKYGSDNIYLILSKGVANKPYEGSYIYPYDTSDIYINSLDRELPEVKLSEMIASCYADPEYRWSGMVRQIWKTAGDAIKNISKSMKPEDFTPEKFGRLAMELVEQLDAGKSIDRTIKL